MKIALLVRHIHITCDIHLTFENSSRVYFINHARVSSTVLHRTSCVRRSSVNFHMSAYVCFAPRTHIRVMRVPQTICETTHKKPHSHIISNFWPQQPTTMSPQIALRLTRFSHGKFLKPQNLLPITPYITYHICRLAVFVFC